MKLYELSTNYKQIVDMLDSADDNQFEVLLDTLESIEDEIEVKADQIARIISSKVAESKMLIEESNRLIARSERIRKETEQLKGYLQDNMIKTGKQKFSTPLYNFSIRNNAPSVQITDETAIPKEYIREVVETKIDKKAISEKLKNNEEVAGAILSYSQSLIIK